MYCFVNILEDNIGEYLGGLGFGDDLLIQHQKHNPLKKKLLSWISLKLETSVL